jgi:hypothetical protein
MYLPTFGGSGLLHLLAAHPRVVAIFGLAATVGALMAPQAPGRLVGTDRYMERIEAAIRPQIAVAEARQTDAERDAVRMLDGADEREIRDAVRHMLKQCGSGCTDISTERILADRALLVRVLMLNELDKIARGTRAAAATGGRPAPATTGTN